jgi:uncharacterized damage-inducible protein DinB
VGAFYFTFIIQLKIMQRTKWFERKFPLMEDNGLLPEIIERLEGTIPRVAALIKDVDENTLSLKPDGKWSIKEHIGHLSDLEPLWLGRMEEFEQRLPQLRPADLTNQKTHEANHNSKDVLELLNEFSAQRRMLIRSLRNSTDEDLLFSSLHPRLQKPMRIIDHAYFVAEHDDHHLTDIREILVAHTIPLLAT